MLNNALKMQKLCVAWLIPIKTLLDPKLVSLEAKLMALL